MGQGPAVPPASASPLTAVACLSRTFDQTVGTFNELQTYLQGYVATLDRDDKKRHAR